MLFMVDYVVINSQVLNTSGVSAQFTFRTIALNYYDYGLVGL